MLQAASENGNILEARSLFGKMPQTTLVSWTSLIFANAQAGMIIGAEELFQNMPQRNEVSWNAMVSSYSMLGDPDRAVDFLKTMPHISTIAWTSIITANAASGNLGKAKAVFDSMPEHNLVVWNTLIAAYCRAGNLRESTKTLGRMPAWSTLTWNAVVAACGHHGYTAVAVGLYHSMELEGMKPDATTYAGILTARSHAGQLESARSHFVGMVADHGILPSLQHYCCMVDILGRLGRLEDAQDLIDSMPYLPDHAVCVSLLAARRSHGEIGSINAPKCNVSEDKSAPYMLLSTAMLQLTFS
ncbi:hypothetical protein SELMODRAFT_128024 [Selaginella moellendorffii]|uniref:Pentacotripeptide-repeat region of PRORP domain-containing protein n=2 Tax=Selaginella moellendorffii TaxID=88036 RepID=D8SYM6_SELML|nr:hypothetical protein SELMODRAFT_128024 [Selaginella moellendorffii]